MSEMFQSAYSFNQNIGNWNTANVTNMSKMFFGDLELGSTVLNFAFANGVAQLSKIGTLPISP
jgi:surface protein